MTHAIDVVLSVILLLCGLVLSAVGFVDAFLAALMTKAGIGGQAQTLILVVVAVLLVVAVLRRLGGVFGGLLVILLFLLVLRWAMPGLHVPAARLPAGWQHFGAVQT